MAFKVRGLSAIADPALQDALKSIESAVNQTAVAAGVSPNGPAPAPTNAGNLTVVQSSSIYDVVISDPANQQGETYFLEWDTQASFATARMIQLGAARSWRGNLGNPGNTWWRLYKQLPGSNPSAWITFSGNPVAGSGAAGPAPGVPKGSGSSNQSGRGFGTIGG
jgi:hypothetical protein